MANQWLRLWFDLPNDPKFRTVAKISQEPISVVIAVYIHMLCCAGSSHAQRDVTQCNAVKRNVTNRNAMKRGKITGWCDDDIANALDIETAQIKKIRGAMQGKLLQEDYLTGWEKRQPLREDDSSERVRAWRAAKLSKNNKQDVTQCNAVKRNVTLEEIREDKRRIEEEKEREKKKNVRGSRLPSNWIAPQEFLDFCVKERPDLDPSAMEAKFRDYWSAKPGKDGLKCDWLATWRNFVRSERARQLQQQMPFQNRQEKAKEWAEKLIGKKADDRDIIDVN